MREAKYKYKSCLQFFKFSCQFATLGLFINESSSYKTDPIYTLTMSGNTYLKSFVNSSSYNLLGE